MQLDLMGYAISTGSACSTGSSRPSHVLAAMGCAPEEAIDSVRISLGGSVSRGEIAGFLSALAGALPSAAARQPVAAPAEVAR